MSKKWIGIGVLIAGAAVILAQNTSRLTGSTDDKFNTLANIQPGLGTVMIEYGNRVGNVYYHADPALVNFVRPGWVLKCGYAVHAAVETVTTGANS